MVRANEEEVFLGRSVNKNSKYVRRNFKKVDSEVKKIVDSRL